MTNAVLVEAILATKAVVEVDSDGVVAVRITTTNRPVRLYLNGTMIKDAVPQAALGERVES